MEGQAPLRMALGRASRLLKRLSPAPPRAVADVPNFSYATPEHTLLKRVVHAKREELVMSTALTSVLLIVASSIMYFAETDAQPDKFSSIPASMWWAISTLTTVGYGDVYPVTVLGRVAGGFLALLGIGLFALPTAILGSGLVEAVQRGRPSSACPQCGKPTR